MELVVLVVALGLLSILANTHGAYSNDNNVWSYEHWLVRTGFTFDDPGSHSS